MENVDSSVSIRHAEPGDADDIAGFTQDTWDGGDYIPRVFEEWVESDGDDQRTFVAEMAEDVIGLVQFTLVSDYEAWSQGMRVAPAARGKGVGAALNRTGFEWARKRGATVARNMIFSWNVMGLGLARKIGFRPVASFRWTFPEANPDAKIEGAVRSDPSAAWSFWTTSDTRSALSGLTLHTEESWCLSELTRSRLQDSDASDALIVIQNDGTAGFAYRTRTVEREHDGEEIPHAEYGVAAWRDKDAARDLYGAIARDAAAVGADRCRVLVPEDPMVISDSAAARVEVGDEPDFVMEKDLTANPG
jgi:GNAT superfamily N-acetyltransferase